MITGQTIVVKSEKLRELLIKIKEDKEATMLEASKSPRLSREEFNKRLADSKK